MHVSIWSAGGSQKKAGKNKNEQRGTVIPQSREPFSQEVPKQRIE